MKKPDAQEEKEKGETMAEYIEREAFIAEQRRKYCDNCARRKGMKNGKMKFVYAIGEAPCRACSIGDILDSIEDYPAADVQPVVHGHWIKSPEYEEFDMCSVCGKYDKHRSRANWEHPTLEFIPPFCPNCGAKLDGGQDDV